MIDIKTFHCNMLDENCYIVSDETKECVIIDCGAFYDDERVSIVQYIDTKQFKPKHLLATHGHLDHNFGNNTIFEHYGLRPKIAEEDLQMLNSYEKQAAKFYGMQLSFTLPQADSQTLKDGDEIHFGNTTIRVIATPGHSRGSICFYIDKEQAIFCGDTLFKNSIGRTDLQGGSMMQILQSLQKLSQLPHETCVYSGHGETSTIGEEIKHNPFMN